MCDLSEVIDFSLSLTAREGFPAGVFCAITKQSITASRRWFKGKVIETVSRTTFKMSGLVF